ncbi:MAG: lipid droplet-associated protein [Pseudonocardiaceae bacterium]|nr:lipid droplet-associated protein [Pseudonocardiaceae bacterium]
MSPLPLPVRIAAGLAATAVDQASKLPAQLTGLPVTVISRALQASMRVQQQITELAIRGDEVFALLRPVEDTAPWAHFDEDEVDAGRNGDTGGRPTTVTPGRFTPDPTPTHDPTPTPGKQDSAGELDEADVARALSPDSPGPGMPEPMPGYDEMSLPQLRGKLRALSLQQLEDLLAHEHAYQDRPPFVTMLSNRINTVRSR